MEAPPVVRRRVAACAIALAMLGMPVVGRAATVRVVTPSLGGTPWSADAVAKLRADLDGMLDASPSIKGAHVGVVAVDTASGNVLYERHADEAFQPASTLKLVVGSVALERLGPSFRPTTSARFGSNDVEIEPGGDPLFGTEDVDALAASVARHRLREIDDVVVDLPASSAPAYPNGWTFDDFAQDYAPPITGVTFEENVLHLRVSPGLTVGPTAVVRATPSVPLIAGGASSCMPYRAFLVDVAVTTGPADSENTLDVRAFPNGCREIFGSIALGAAPSDVDVAVPDPSLYLALAVVAALRSHGVTTTGSVTTGRPVQCDDGRPADFVRRGIALRELLPRFWIPSDNFVGETLLLHLAPAGAMGTFDTRDRALDVERAWLRSIGVDSGTTTLADGSGLSQYDRITPRDLVAILEHDWNGPNRQIVLDSLPIGGARGTIEGIAGTPAAGRVFAKTGSMMHVRGLAGYLATQRHGAVTFAFSVDDWIGDYPSLAALRAAVLARIIQD